MTDHLGNVLATVLDRKTGHNPGGGATKYDYYNPDISSAQGYYPFGQRMKEWNNTVGDTVYKYDYNGQRREDAIAGAFNHNTAMFWEYDPLLARRWNRDPKPINAPTFTGTTFNNFYNRAFNVSFSWKFGLIKTSQNDEDKKYDDGTEKSGRKRRL